MTGSMDRMCKYVHHTYSSATGSMDRMCKYVHYAYSSVSYEMYDSVTSQ